MRRSALNVCLVLATLVACVGCRRGSGTVVVKDPGPGQRQQALRLADEALKAEKSGDKAKAVSLYRESLSHSEEFAVVWHNLAMLIAERGEMGDQMEAVRMLQNAAALDTERPTTLYCIGYVYDKNAQRDKALDYFKQALAKDPNYLPALRGVAKVGKSTFLADKESLNWMKTALLIEKDPAWRKVFEEEKLRIDGALQAMGSAGKF
jgi:tetratricopeptide (TPR) repeat protein